MAALNNVISDKDVFMIFETVGMNKDEVRRNVRVRSTNGVRSETEQRVFAESKQNHDTELKCFAHLSTDMPSSSKSAIRAEESSSASVTLLWSYCLYRRHALKPEGRMTIGNEFGNM
jgi:hypothetical protein